MIKSDCAGFGYKEKSERSWEEIYNSAVKNIQVESCEGEISLNVIDDEWSLDYIGIPKLKKKKKKKKLGMQLEYDNFQKSSILYNGCLMQNDSATSEEEEGRKTAQDPVNSSFAKDPYMLTENSILRAITTKSLCTAKLERIALQDQSLDQLLDLTRESCKNNPQPISLPEIYRFASLNLMPTWMACNPLKKEEDKDKTNNNIITFQSPQQIVTVKSKSRAKKYRKKMNNLVDQLSACSIKEIDKESKCDSLRKVKKCNRKKGSFKIKCKPECLQLMKKHNVQSCTTKEDNANVQTRSQHKKEYKPVQPIQIEKDGGTVLSREKFCGIDLLYDLPLAPIEKQSLTLSKRRSSPVSLCRSESSKDGDIDNIPSTDIKNNIKNIVYLKKCLKKQKSRRRRRPRIWEVINNIANKSDTSIDTVAKALTKINLSEDVSTAIKKKPTQTHITPV
ncbi:PREDICTED: uncharacterized protein LOC106747306 isoform X2 [Dinoponera quadriceps]|nr:PREDICTED: uncharacterized protein LOC106747306 isoform X2 [Dinoponera quadriceps]